MAKRKNNMQLREVITVEEGIWLIAGLLFGWFAGKGAEVLLILIPIGLFVAWAYAYVKYGWPNKGVIRR